jgi:hypothetical protein
MTTGTFHVAQKLYASRSAPALLAEYGFRGFSSSVSRLRPRGTLPYTSSVEI